MRVFKQSVTMRFFGSTHRVSEGSWQQAGHGVHNDHRGQSPIGEDIVADAQRFVGQMLPDTLVKPLVAPANQNHMLDSRQFTSHRLVEWTPTRSGEDYSRSRTPKGLHCFKDRFWLENHSWPTAERPVIDRFMPVMGPVAKTVDFEIQNPRLPSPPYDALIQRT